ncbi:MAG TPA: ATP-binding protein [Kofleriaceae bacterium]
MDADPRFEQLFSRSLDGVFFATLDEPVRWDDTADKDALLDYAFDHLRITAVNDAMCEQLQASREELIGTTPRARWLGRPAEWRANQRILFDRGQRRISVRAARADGRPFEVEGSYACFYDSDGRVTGHFGIQRDVTDRLRMQQRLAMSERLASLGTLAAGVGHEINNPLTYIVSNLAVAQRELAALSGAEELAAIRERLAAVTRKIADASYGADRVREIVRDLRSLSAGHEVNDSVDLASVIDRALRLTDHELRQHAVVTREIGPMPPVLGSEGSLVQVMVNLLMNAAQAIPPGNPDGHRIGVEATTADDGSARIEVSDSGDGIAPEALDRIFDPFFTTKEVGTGTGLGLAISHRIVTGLGGDIEVRSEVGRGSRFRVILPAAPGRD